MGCLFMCGDGSFGQLGNGDNQSHDSPFKVLFFASQRVKQVACGMRHSLALVTGDVIYGFGSGRHGQIGKHLSGGQRSLNLPTAVQGFDDHKIVSMHANGDHSAALSGSGQLYIWGRRFSGDVDNHIPQLAPLSLRISQVALGWNHALVMADGFIYMLGGSRHGLLAETQKVNLVEHRLPKLASCTTSNGSLLTLERVPCLDEKVVSIAAGAEHSALVTEKGSVMTWGWGEHGQLGLGDTSDQTCPQKVKLGCNGSFISSQSVVYCGSGFTIVTKSTE
ncbi:hypothetical protein BHE74_00011955 [Ensete ventricosum]|nr:hypothetical protein BHE74_00011955 [Ensete ventricosum]